ncbi:MAG TPA: hypothetical protein DCF63_07400 [Planctomycetaceae bacterium]|nr:hypothetical protein [Planctomycetaceae bacterium]
MIFGRKKKSASSDAGPLVLDDKEQKLPPVEFKPDAGSKQEQEGVLISCRSATHYPVAVMLVAHAIGSRADQIMIDFTAQGAALRLRVDGLWEKLPPLERETADGMLVVLKKL